MRPHVDIADAKSLPYRDKSFDYIIPDTKIHNLKCAEIVQLLRRIERAARLGSFITVDANRNDKEKERMLAWNLTAKTTLHVDKCKELSKEAGYSGDYHWFIA